MVYIYIYIFFFIFIKIRKHLSKISTRKNIYIFQDKQLMFSIQSIPIIHYFINNNEKQLLYKVLYKFITIILCNFFNFFWVFLLYVKEKKIE